MTGRGRVRAVSPVTERARALVAERTPEAVAIGRAAGDLINDPGVRRDHPCRAGSPRRPRVPRGPAPRRPGHRPLARRAPAAARRREPGDPRHHPSRSGGAHPRRRRRAAPRDGPRAALAGLRPARPHDHRRAGTHVAARPPGGGAGRRLDHHRLARARRRPRHPRRAVPLGRARAARLLALALGAAPRGLDDRDHPARRPRRRPAAGDRPQGLAILADLIGDADPDVQKALSWALRSLSTSTPAPRPRSCARGGHGPRDGRRPSRLGRARRPREAPRRDGRRAADRRRRHPQAPRRPIDLPRRRSRRGFTGLGVAVPPADRSRDRG